MNNPCKDAIYTEHLDYVYYCVSFEFFFTVKDLVQRDISLYGLLN